ncbi:MAG: methyltransferase domain-containing protein [Candidatus Methanoperedens sp.]|nr:methyltransferase domain-containing protein [Candidatus Methanoperedens sp.]
MSIEYTGERFIPGMGGAQIHYEHIHRYAFASLFVKGKKVLDLACGEGYGSNILSKETEYVVGMDIDETAVEHARNKYLLQNLEFIQGSILDIPILGSEKFDVIICFEGIEHVEEPERLLSEVKRLLKKNGLFIVSSPNKKTYSDDPAYINPFHKKELYFIDFRDLLNKYFRNLLFFGQKVYGASSIWSLPPCPRSIYEEFIIEKKDNEFYFSDPSKKSPQFFISIASDKKLDQESCTINNLLDISNILIGENANVENLEQHTKNLEKIVDNREMRISDLEKLVADKETKRSDLEQHTKNLEKIVDNREMRISDLEKLVADKETKRSDLEQHTKNLEKIVDNREMRISDLEKLVADKETKRSDLEQHTKNLEKIVDNREMRISDLEKLVADKETKRSDLEQHTKNLEKIVDNREMRISDLEKLVADKETKRSDLEKAAEDLHKLLGVRAGLKLHRLLGQKL